MAFLGDVELVAGRSPSQTTTLVLQKCMRCTRKAAETEIDGFLERLLIKPKAFFRDIDTDWIGRPFIGQHVFKVIQAAGYGGTEDDLWLAVIGATAPYAVKGRGGQQQKSTVSKPKMMLKDSHNKRRLRRNPQ